MSDLKGKTVVFAGRIPGHTRASLRDLPPKHSVRMVRRLSSRVDYMVIGPGATFRALQDAYVGPTCTIDLLAFAAMLEPEDGAPRMQADVVALAMASLTGRSPSMTKMSDRCAFQLALSEERAGRRQNADTILAIGMDSTAALRLARVAMYCALDGRREAAQEFADRAAACLPVVHPPMVSRIHSALAVCRHYLDQPARPHLAQARAHRSESGRDDWPLITALILVGQVAEADTFMAAHSVTERTGDAYDAVRALQDLALALPLEVLLTLKQRWVAGRIVEELTFVPVLADALLRAGALDRLGVVLAGFVTPWYQRMLMDAVLVKAAASGEVSGALLAQTGDLWEEPQFRFGWLHLASQHAPSLAREALATWEGKTSDWPAWLYPLGQALTLLGINLDSVQASEPQRVALLAGAGRLDEAHALLRSVAVDAYSILPDRERDLWSLLALAGQDRPPAEAARWLKVATDRFAERQPGTQGALVDVLADGGAVRAAYRAWLACPYHQMRWRYEEKLLQAACAARDFTVLYAVLARLSWHTRTSRASAAAVALSGSAGVLWE